MSASEAPCPKAVVVHAGGRDHYQLALALSEADLLESLVTDFYWKLPAPLESRARAWIPPRYFNPRRCEGLPGERVRISPRAAMYGLTARWGNDTQALRQMDEALSLHGAHLASRGRASLFCYSYYGMPAFSQPGIERKFLFQLHPHPRALRKLFLEELERVPEAKASLMQEHELALSEEAFSQLAAESDAATGWMAASTYTKQTLESEGVPGGKTVVVPYGVDVRKFARPWNEESHRPLRVLFVGSMVQRKGISYLLDAFARLKSQHIELTLIGRGGLDEALLKARSTSRVNVLRHLSLEALISQMHQHDVLAFPSLAEGFAHVILEAMAAGLPVITTPHTCGPDVFATGQEGFIVPIRDVDALAEKLEWCASQRSTLRAMGVAAARTAGSWTWERFRAGVREGYRLMAARHI